VVTRFPGRRADAQPPFGNQDPVDDRQFRRAVAIEDELRLDRAPPRDGWFVHDRA
jgi:hypothetical protein